MTDTVESRPLDFVREIIVGHNESGRFGGKVHTRFPPEPNGYLHIGHSKSICLNFGVAQEFGGKANLRFDDTNPTKEEQEYIDAIIADVRWLGFDWEDRLFYASDYFQQLYDWAVQLIEQGQAYVDGLSAEEIRAYRGTLTEPGKESPFRNHPRVVATPHLAANTPRGATGMACGAAESIIAVLAGRLPALEGAVVVPGGLPAELAPAV